MKHEDLTKIEDINVIKLSQGNKKTAYISLKAIYEEKANSQHIACLDFGNEICFGPDINEECGYICLTFRGTLIGCDGDEFKILAADEEKVCLQNINSGFVLILSTEEYQIGHFDKVSEK